MTIETREIDPKTAVRQAAAARKRLHRARTRRGQRVFSVIAKTDDVVATLRAFGELGPEETDDPDLVEQALNRWVAELVANKVTRSVGNR